AAQAPTPAEVSEIKTRFDVYPAGTQLDTGFWTMLQKDHPSLDCDGTNSGLHCLILRLDLNGDGKAEVIVIQNWRGQVFSQAANGWQHVGILNLKDSTAVLRVALKEGNYATVKPGMSDLRMGNRVYR